jgi:hypothetical protein
MKPLHVRICYSMDCIHREIDDWLDDGPFGDEHYVVNRQRQTLETDDRIVKFLTKNQVEDRHRLHGLNMVSFSIAERVMLPEKVHYELEARVKSNAP